MEERRELFSDQTGHITDMGLRDLLGGTLGELERLETAEHLSFCDSCVERYAALLSDEALMEAPELLRQGVMQKLRQKILRTMVNRYFTMGVAACLALVFWVTGVFNMAAIRPDYGAMRERKPAASLSRMANDFAAGISGPVSQFLSSIDLRGARTNEKK